MKTYCLVCRKNTDNVNSKMIELKNDRLQLKSQCSICENKKSRFVKKQELKGILSSLGIRIPLLKIPGLNILFSCTRIIKMNKANSIINNFLLVGDKFMPKLHLVDPIVKKYSACGPFTKHIERIQDFLNTGKLSFIYKIDLDKACFQHGIAYNKFKGLEKRTQSDIVLQNKALKIASNPKYNGYKRGLASMVYKFFGKKLKGSGLKENQQLAN